MRTDIAHTRRLAALGFTGLLAFAGHAFAQTPPAGVAPTGVPAPASPAAPVPPAKPTVETAATPVEQIKLNGRTLPLNIKTLAEVQRLNEEKELREKIQDALKTGGAVQIQASNLQATTPATPMPTAASTPTSTVAKKPRPAAPSNTLVAVYGPGNNLKAEVFVGKNESRELKAGDSFGKFRVAKISQTGIQLEPLAGGQQGKFVSVGQSLTN